MGAPKLQQKYSYADYLLWPDTERWELINGEAYNMSPAPKRAHQIVVGNIFSIFSNYLDDKTCQVFIAPFDVRLFTGIMQNQNIETVVQPDVSIFCDENKLDEYGAHAAPDLVVEVLSDSTRDKDLNRKLLLYQNHGVTEYWIADPDKKTMLQFILQNNRYQFINELTVSDIIYPSIFPDFEISLAKIFK